MAFHGANMLAAIGWGNPGEQAAKDAGGKDKVYGTKPEVAEFTELDLTEEQLRALTGNLANADSIEALLNRMVPGWSEMLQQGTGNALSLLRGEIPQDVQDQIQRSSAYQSFAGGYAGSGMSKALTARDLGRTSLDLTQTGANSAQMWAKTAQSGYAPWMIDTAMQAQATTANNAGVQAQQQHQFNVDAAPDPRAVGVFNTNTAIGMQMLSMGMGMAGGAMGGAGGAGMVQGAQQGGGAGWNPTASGTNWSYNASSGQYEPLKWGGA